MSGPRMPAGAGEQPEQPVPYAGPVLRLAGFFVDQAVAAAPLVPALVVAGVREARLRDGAGEFLNAYTWASLVLVVYYWVGHAVWGMTLGKWLVGIQVVRADGRVPGWGWAALRALAVTLGDVVAPFSVLDCAWLLWDRRRQTLHDKVAGTFVVVRRPRHALKVLGVSFVLMVAGQIGLTFAVLRPLVLQAYWVPSGSMRETLIEKDRLIANKLAYDQGALRRQDVVVFRAPPWVEAKPTDFIKRVIGLPGDTVEVREGRVFINGATVEEPYVRSRPYYDWGPVTVPAGHVVVLGDNRNNSRDSHLWTKDGKPAPFLPVGSIHGRAIFRFWPLTRWGDLPPGPDRPDLDALRRPAASQ